MARAYSLDLRERVVAAVTSGQTCRSVAKTFGVSVASVVKWSQRFRATGSAAAKPMGGRRRYALEDERDWILARINEAPDLTLRALAAELAARGIAVSHYAVWHFLKREGITLKRKSARRRAREAQGGATARAAEALSEQA
jgi:transposase